MFIPFFLTSNISHSVHIEKCQILFSGDNPVQNNRDKKSTTSEDGYHKESKEEKEQRYG